MSRRLMLASLVMAATAGQSSAQPVFHRVETLEWLAADCPIIVRGTVADFARDVDEHGDTWDTVVVKVRETIKGAHQRSHTFVIGNPRDWSLEKAAFHPTLIAKRSASYSLLWSNVLTRPRHRRLVPRP